MTDIKKLTLDNKGELTNGNGYTYDKGLYYINNSGLVCPLPDQIEARAQVRAEYLENDDGSYRSKG